MFREMRRKKQKLTEKQCIDILKRAKTNFTTRSLTSG